LSALRRGLQMNETIARRWSATAVVPPLAVRGCCPTWLAGPTTWFLADALHRATAYRTGPLDAPVRFVLLNDRDPALPALLPAPHNDVRCTTEERDCSNSHPKFRPTHGRQQLTRH
jgi:hypothetical protein